jgi:hypothetical protein
VEQLFTLAGQFGPIGLMVGYLMLRERRQDAMMEKRIEADKLLAVSLALLTEIVKGGR